MAAVVCDVSCQRLVYFTVLPLADSSLWNLAPIAAESPLPLEGASDSPYRLQTGREGNPTRVVPGLDWAQQYAYGGQAYDGPDQGDEGARDDSVISEPSPYVPARAPTRSRLDARAHQLASRHRVSVDNALASGGHAGLVGLTTGNPANVASMAANETHTQGYIQSLRSEIHALVKVSEKLEEENATLKDVNMRATMDDVIASQRERMVERELASDELVKHWRGKFEKLEEMVSSGYVEELEDQNQDLSARVHGLEIEKTDLTLKLKESEAKIAELQKRNAFLEKYARVYPTKEAGMGTEGVQRVDVGIQAPHAVVQHRARAMAPEGVPSESMYTYGVVDAAGPHFGGMYRGHQERTYELLPQATIPHGVVGAKTGGSAGTSSVGIAAGQGARGMPDTKESRMRTFAQHGPLLGPDGRPRQIEFYSGSEDRIDRGDRGERPAAPDVREHSDLSVSPDERRLLQDLGLEAEILGATIIYRHPHTGFMFKLSRSIDDGDEDDSGDGFDLKYEPVAWGRARAAISTLLEGILLDTSSIHPAGRVQLLTMIGNALKDC